MRLVTSPTSYLLLASLVIACGIVLIAWGLIGAVTGDGRIVLYDSQDDSTQGSRK